MKIVPVLFLFAFAFLAACAPSQTATVAAPSVPTLTPPASPPAPTVPTVTTSTPLPAPSAPSTVPATLIPPLAATPVPTISSGGGPSGGPPQPQLTPVIRRVEGSLNVQGRTRTYLLYLPPAARTQRLLPLLIALHAQGQNSSDLERESQLDAVADKSGFLVAYPDGTGATPGWNVGDCCGDAQAQQVDDVAFVRALIDTVQRAYLTDPARVFAVGIAEGGMLAQRLGVALGGPANGAQTQALAGIAMVAARLPAGLSAPARPLPVVLLQGAADPQLPAGAAAASLAFWTQGDGCAPEPQRQDTGVLSRETYGGCRNDVTVVHYSIKGGGHSWPQTTPLAAELIWSFFAPIHLSP